METTSIKLFGKKITCYDSPKITNIPVFTTVAGEDSNDEHLEEDQEDGNPNEETRKTETNSQLKKPDTILPCPRCKSRDTKFCYYNNYNVKQPRHFCKSCQRYWTAGGTMRTMPVGAGRRRNKNTMSNSRFETIISQEAFQYSSQINVSNRLPSKFLSFGLDLAHVDKLENGDECSSGSTVTTCNSVAEKPQDTPSVSWSYNHPAGYSPMPMPIYPPPYSWNYIPSWLPLQNDINSSVLGKRSRQQQPELIKSDGSEEPKKQKHSVLIPKTLRIDNPDEAAKSSIWLTLGINNENISTRGLFKDFRTKDEEYKRHLVKTSSPVLQANPAAFSRSLCFQERA